MTKVPTRRRNPEFGNTNSLETRSDWQSFLDAFLNNQNFSNRAENLKRKLYYKGLIISNFMEDRGHQIEPSITYALVIAMTTLFHTMRFTLW